MFKGTIYSKDSLNWIGTALNTAPAGEIDQRKYTVKIKIATNMVYGLSHVWIYSRW